MKKKKFQVGDKVKIRTDSRYYKVQGREKYPPNNYRMFIIDKVSTAAVHCYGCMSTDGYHNSYREIDLISYDDNEVKYARKVLNIGG